MVMVDQCWDPGQHLEEQPELAEAREEGGMLEKSASMGVRELLRGLWLKPEPCPSPAGLAVGKQAVPHGRFTHELD